jgi:hypothetical protein
MIANRACRRWKAQVRGEIALTLLRCVGWLSRDDFSNRRGHAGPSLATPGAQMPGIWTFDYSLIPHFGGWQSAFDQAAAFNAPLRAVFLGRGNGSAAGSLAPEGAFLQVPAVFAIVVKQADGARLDRARP